MPSDPNVEAICAEHRARAEHGLRKYGVTTERTDLSPADWLQHAKEEAMDLTVYLHVAKQHVEKASADVANLQWGLIEAIRVLKLVIEGGALPDEQVLGLCIDPYGLLDDLRRLLPPAMVAEHQLAKESPHG